MHLHSFQNTELKLHSYVKESTGQFAERLTILPYTLGGVRSKGLTTQKT